MENFTSRFSQKFLKAVIVSIFLFGTISSCNPLSLFSRSQASSQSSPQAEVVFQVLLPAALPENTSLSIEFLDDVTGLSLNPQRLEMTKQDERSFYIKIPLVIGSVTKYRYTRQVNGVNNVEYSPQGNQIRYRLASISGPAIIQDNVAAWIDEPNSSPIGRVRGQFIDQENNSPIPNLLVTAEGVQTVTSSDGSFILEGLTPGTHTLVAYSMDGQFNSFSQGVTIAEEATTPVFVYLEKRKTVKVTFNVTLPENSQSQLPLRFASNDQSIGNVYADLFSGSTTVAANLPTLTKLSTGHYQIQLNLPVGFDLHYKYTLGDGLWNSELDSSGGFLLRELIIPQNDITINDVVTTFKTPNEGAVSFLVTASTLPSDEIVSIQFNPFGWFQSIPMTKIGENQWLFTLYSPLNLFNQIEYRFCRNDLCEQTQNISQSQQVFAASPQDQTINQDIEQWTNLSPSTQPSVVVTDGGLISPHSDFSAGFEVTDNYLPIWPAYISNGLNNIATTGSNLVVLSPTWTATRNSPPYLEPIPGKDISWNEMQTTIIKSTQANLDVALFPRVNYPTSAAEYWDSAKRDDGWWTSWYDRYHRYMMQVADWAALTGVKVIIIGDPSVNPSTSNGLLANGNPANSPATADAQWLQLILDIRSRFSGTILGAIAYPSTAGTPGWLTSVDGVYLLYSPALAQVSNASVPDLENLITNDLEGTVLPSLSVINKPVWLALNYPSAVNAFAGCTDTLGSCLDDWGNGQIDLETQLHIYNAAIIVAAKEQWINGFIARGAEPIAALQDSSPSVLSKPANDALWFWYHFILNKTP
ncbi:MAG: carboxypeptidase regulatory-like domain-containing protein [Anaerolineaceae bacterium]